MPIDEDEIQGRKKSVYGETHAKVSLELLNGTAAEMKQLRASVAELEQVIRVISPMNKELLGSNQDMSARIAQLEYLIACNVDPMNCTDEDAELCRECHKTAFPENYRI